MDKVIFIIMCCLFYYSMADSNVNKIDIRKNDIVEYFSKSNNVYSYIEEWYKVLPNHLQIVLVDYGTAFDIKCRLPDNRYTGTSNTELYGKKYRITIEKQHVISGTWFCKLFHDLKTRHIYFRVRVKGEVPPQQIVVNHINLNIIKVINNYEAKYFYKDGEAMNVDCISADQQCSVHMNNPFSPQGNDQYKDLLRGAGYWLKLNSEDNGKTMKCISNCSGNYIVVEVKFELKVERDSHITIKIDNQDVTFNKVFESHTYYNIEYAYFINNRLVQVTCDTDLEDLNLSCPNCDEEPRGNKIIFTPNIMSILTCKAKDEEVEIRFQLITSQDNSQLTLQGLNRSNILLVSHVYKHQVSYIQYTYQYEDRDIILLNCSKNSDVSSDPRPKFISLNNSVSGTLELSLNMVQNNTQIQCCLHDLNEDNKTIVEISVLFHRKEHQIILSSTESPNLYITTNETLIMDPNQWLYPTMAVLIVIILICVIIVIYRMKKRHRPTLEAPDNTYDYCMTNLSILHYNGVNVSEYAVPEGEMVENNLYIRTNDSYTTVIPKTQRQSNKEQNIYAEPNEPKQVEGRLNDTAANNLYSRLNLRVGDRSEPRESHVNSGASSNLKMFSDVYSKPFDKTETSQSTYSNVTGESHYANKIGGYCIYPTYSEPHVRNSKCD